MGKLLMNPRETCLLLANLLEDCWGIAASERQSLISQDGAEREVSFGRGEEKVIMFHLLLERIAVLPLPTWGLRALTAPRPTVVFPGVRVSLASTPGKLPFTLCWPNEVSHKEAIGTGQGGKLNVSASAPFCPNQVGGEPGHLSQELCLPCVGRVTIPPVSALSLA